MVFRLRELAPHREAGITQPRDHSLAEPCTGARRTLNGTIKEHIFGEVTLSSCCVNSQVVTVCARVSVIVCYLWGGISMVWFHVLHGPTST